MKRKAGAVRQKAAPRSLQGSLFFCKDMHPPPGLASPARISPSSRLMALHIRDFRQSDEAGLNRLCQTGRLLGQGPAPGDPDRILIGLRAGNIAGAAWLRLQEDAGTLLAIVTASSGRWQSDALELIAEASLWLSSRGAPQIELKAIPTDPILLAGLEDMQFVPEGPRAVLRRQALSRSVA